MNEVVSFTIAEVPAYLQKSEFYDSLDKNEDEITLSKEHFKPNLYVRTLSDMHHLLSTMRFWGVKGIPKELVMFVANNPETELQATLAEFTQELKCVTFLQALGRELKNIYPDRNIIFRYISQDKFLTWGTMQQRLVNLLKLQFTYENGQIWNEDTCKLAARIGSLDCLTFLHENGCPWGGSTIEEAIAEKSDACFQYTIENDCPGSLDACRYAHNNIKSQRFLREEMHCPWDIRVSNACANSFSDNADSLRYCVDNGCPVDETTM